MDYLTGIVLSPTILSVVIGERMNQNLSFYRANSHDVQVTVMHRDPTLPLNADVVPMDLTDTVVVMSAKRNPQDTVYALSKTGVLATDPTTGVVTFSFVPGDTRGMLPGIYYMDVRVQDGTNYYTVVTGNLEILESVTR